MAVDPTYSYSADNRKKDAALYTIAESGTIKAANKDTMTQAWVRAKSCYTEFATATAKYGLSSSSEYTTYTAAFQAVSDMLNNGVSYTAVSDSAQGPSWCQGVNYQYLNDVTFLDDTQTDGYKVFPSTCASGDYEGKANTAKIVAHAQKVINGYLAESYPTTLQELADAMAALRAANATATNLYRYDEFFYPLAYGCYLYEPTADNLNDAWKKGQWYLPAQGELERLCNFARWGTAIENAADGANEAHTPIFANANKKIGKATVTFPIGHYYGSTENTAAAVYSIYTNDNNLIARYGKCLQDGVVSPCTAFTFLL